MRAYMGINAADNAPSPNNLRNKFGSVNANVNADQTGPAPNAAAAARLSFDAETIRCRVNAYLGPDTVARIAVKTRESAPSPTG
ncbi:MAG: hypothetical protein AAGK78_02280, partial [Planctomycetota bacterium]